ncbi:MAG: hypothetical protein QW292_03725 [Candidatus Parvarchaeota archaeon]
MYFCILQAMSEKGKSLKISVREVLSGPSKIYVIADGAKRSVADVPERSRKIADLLGLMLFPEILWIKVTIFSYDI